MLSFTSAVRGLILSQTEEKGRKEGVMLEAQIKQKAESRKQKAAL